MQHIWHGTKALKMSKVVHDMLTQLRKPDASRWLWIDAICIIQMDPLEQACQVTVMCVIYASAGRTLIWLGSETAETKSALQAVGRLTKSRARLEIPILGDLRNRYASYTRRLVTMREECSLPSSCVEVGDSIALFKGG